MSIHELQVEAESYLMQLLSLHGASYEYDLIMCLYHSALDDIENSLLLSKNTPINTKDILTYSKDMNNLQAFKSKYKDISLN